MMEGVMTLSESIIALLLDDNNNPVNRNLARAFTN